MPSCGLCILPSICSICYLISEFFENFVNLFFSEGRESPFFYAGRIMLVLVCVERFCCSEIHYFASQSGHSSAFQHLFSRSSWVSGASQTDQTRLPGAVLTLRVEGFAVVVWCGFFSITVIFFS